MRIAELKLMFRKYFEKTDNFFWEYIKDINLLF